MNSIRKDPQIVSVYCREFPDRLGGCSHSRTVLLPISLTFPKWHLPMASQTSNRRISATTRSMPQRMVQRISNRARCMALSWRSTLRIRSTRGRTSGARLRSSCSRSWRLGWSRTFIAARKFSLWLLSLGPGKKCDIPFSAFITVLVWNISHNNRSTVYAFVVLFFISQFWKIHAVFGWLGM